MKIKYALGLMLFSAVQTIHGQPTSEFFFTGSVSSWVGHGLTETITPGNGSLTQVLGSTVGLHMDITTSDGAVWLLDIDANYADTIPLSVGEYDDATRFPFNVGTPGLSFFGDGRGDNTITGSFNVLGITYVNDVITSAAVDFVQYDEGIQKEWTFGSLRYNSSLPLTPVPEPGTIALLALGVAGFRLVCRKDWNIFRSG